VSDGPVKVSADAASKALSSNASTRKTLRWPTRRRCLFFLGKFIMHLSDLLVAIRSLENPEEQS